MWGEVPPPPRRASWVVHAKRVGRDRRRLSLHPIPAWGSRIERSAMYIVAQHRIKDPARFWSAARRGPGAQSLQAAYPSLDKTRGVCLWESDSIDTLRESL